MRDSISRHLGIRPEDVTRNQIRHAVADLLPYYPAITVIPQGPEPDTDKTELGELRNAVNNAEDKVSDRPTSIARDSPKHSNSHEKFQMAVDAAKKLFLRDIQEIAHRLRGMPITLSYQLFPDIIQPCIRKGFALFLMIAKKFPNEIIMNPAKWASSIVSEVIIEKSKNGPFEVYVPQLISLLSGEEAEAILLEEAILEEAGHKASEGARADLEVAKDSIGIVGSKKKRGPQAKMEFHCAVAEVVQPFGPNWKESLEQIARKLAKRKLPPSAAWAKRNPPAISWERAVACYPHLVLKTIEYSLEMAAKNIPEKPSETLGNLR